MSPPAPWHLTGQGWLSIFRVRDGGARPEGVYAAGFVGYQPGSTLVYSELLVARPVPGGRGRLVEVTDIWVDSADSRDGGRTLWAIPKELCDFAMESSRSGPLARTSWAASLARRPVAEAWFTDLSRAAPRLPFRGGTRQPGIDGGPARSARLAGTARALPCRGRWDFAADGPLGWLRGQRQLASFRMADFRITFGRGADDGR